MIFLKQAYKVKSGQVDNLYLPDRDRRLWKAVPIAATHHGGALLPSAHPLMPWRHYAILDSALVSLHSAG